MNTTDATVSAQRLMQDFAGTTGLDPPSPRPRRYLWTDAFAVCNYLGFFGKGGDPASRELAKRLIDQVHHTLGRYRGDDLRSGWISGLSEEEGGLHPAIGGLRIGKELPERRAAEPYDDRQEWDRDGQYFHYLTQWMHALSLAGRVTGNMDYLCWAIELARTAHARFTYRTGDGMRMYWKMSTDLARPLVTSMGQYDPLDGLVTYAELRAAAGRDTGQQQILVREMEEMAGMVRHMPLATSDPLGIGGLLSCAARIGRLIAHGSQFPQDIFRLVIVAAMYGLSAFPRSRCLDLAADCRLAFRELGLAIGLAATEPLPALILENPQIFKEPETLTRTMETLGKYKPLKERILAFWLDEGNRTAGTWTGHREINTVMLATCLAPDGYLGI